MSDESKSSESPSGEASRITIASAEQARAMLIERFFRLLNPARTMRAAINKLKEDISGEGMRLESREDLARLRVWIDEWEHLLSAIDSLGGGIVEVRIGEESGSYELPPLRNPRGGRT